MNQIETSYKDKFTKKLFALVLPIAFQQFMLAVVGASDAFMLGALNQASLSAISLAGQVQFVHNLFLMAVTIGTSMFAAQYWGKGDMVAVDKIMAIALRVSTAISLLFFLATMFFPVLLMRIFTTDTILLDDGAVYLRTVSLSYLLCGISQIYLCIMKNTGHVIQSMMISTVIVIVNIILNTFLIFGLWHLPKMGIAGAAVATVISRIIELLWVYLYSLKKGRNRAHISYILHIDQQLKEHFWKYTLSVLGNELVWGCGFTMYSVIMGHLGNDAVAANSVATIVKNLIICFCMGIGNGGSIIVGHELGAGQLERAKEYGRQLCKLSIVSGVISGALLLAISPAILYFMNLSPQSSTYLKWMLVICSYYIVGKSINGATIAGIFCAGGDSKFGLLCDTITLWCITIPLGFIAAFVLKLPVIVVYFVINLDEIIKIPAVYKHYRKYMWVKNLTI